MKTALPFALMFLLLASVAFLVRSADGEFAVTPVRGVFLTVETPDLSADELALLDELKQVESFGELEALLTAEVAVLAIDDSALALLPDGFLARQYKTGRAVIGINIFAPDLAQATGAELPGPGHTPESWALTHDGHGEGAFYSYQRRSPVGATITRSSSGQHHFKDRLFAAVLQQLLDGYQHK